jgi:hypothetical protein
VWVLDFGYTTVVSLSDVSPNLNVVFINLLQRFSSRCCRLDYWK